MTIDRIPAARAYKATERVLRKLGLELANPGPQDCGTLNLTTLGLVGSLRRGANTVHDVDLLAPLPTDAEPDMVHDAVARLFGDTKAADRNPLYAAVAAPGSEWGRVLEGLAPGFKKLTLEVNLRGDAKNPDPGWSTPFALKLEVHRYTPGPKGNRGWIEMIRTGPSGDDQELGWGPMMLIRWKQRNAGGRSHQGWPTFADGTRHPVPDEASAFRAVGLQWIAPKDRSTVLAKQLAGARRTA